MTKLIDWVKTHKALTLLLVIVAFLLFRLFSPQNTLVLNRMANPSSVGSSSFGTMEAQSEAAVGVAGISMGVGKAFPTLPYRQPAPPSDTTTRMISKDTSLSLKVDNVASTVEKIEQTTNSLGGYLIDSNISIPEGASNGSINVRVPAEKRSE